MKAIVFDKYGSPDVLQLQEVKKPEPADNEVLIKVFAATVTAGDCEMRAFRIEPLIWLPLRLFMGITKPRIRILGQEFSGEVVAVGPKVTFFKKGDHVFAPTDMNLGACAQYKCLPESSPMAIKPAEISFDEAATIPTGGLNALHFLRKAQITSGQKILINGAGGSIGTYAIQLAKLYGAEVTAVDSGKKLKVLQSLGADHVIDYEQADFSELADTFDVIFDIWGKAYPFRGIRALKPGGSYLMGNISFSILIGTLITSVLGRKKVKTGLANYKEEDLLYLRDLMAKGHIRSVIDKKYTLEQTAEAHRYVDSGEKTGHVVIRVGHE